MCISQDKLNREVYSLRGCLRVGGILRQSLELGCLIQGFKILTKDSRLSWRVENGIDTVTYTCSRKDCEGVTN